MIDDSDDDDLELDDDEDDLAYYGQDELGQWYVRYPQYDNLDITSPIEETEALSMGHFSISTDSHIVITRLFYVISEQATWFYVSDDHSLEQTRVDKTTLMIAKLSSIDAVAQFNRV